MGGGVPAPIGCDTKGILVQPLEKRPVLSSQCLQLQFIQWGTCEGTGHIEWQTQLIINTTQIPIDCNAQLTSHNCPMKPGPASNSDPFI